MSDIGQDAQAAGGAAILGEFIAAHERTLQSIQDALCSPRRKDEEGCWTTAGEKRERALALGALGDSISPRVHDDIASRLILAARRNGLPELPPLISNVKQRLTEFIAVSCTFAPDPSNDGSPPTLSWNVCRRELLNALDALRVWSAALAVGPETPRPNGQAPDEAIGKFDYAQLAKKYDVSADKLRKRLGTWRKRNMAGFVEDTERGPTDPQFYYDEAAVLPVIEAIRNGQRMGSKKKSSAKSAAK